MTRNIYYRASVSIDGGLATLSGHVAGRPECHASYSGHKSLAELVASARKHGDTVPDSLPVLRYDLAEKLPCGIPLTDYRLSGDETRDGIYASPEVVLCAERYGGVPVMTVGEVIGNHSPRADR